MIVNSGYKRYDFIMIITTVPLFSPSYKLNSLGLAHPIVTEGYHFAAIGYLDDQQLPLVDIVEQIVKSINRLADYASSINIGYVIVYCHIVKYDKLELHGRLLLAKKIFDFLLDRV